MRLEACMRAHAVRYAEVAVCTGARLCVSVCVSICMCVRECVHVLPCVYVCLYADAVLALGARTHMRKDICMQASTEGARERAFAFVCASVCASMCARAARMQKGFLPAPTNVAPHAHARARASA